MSPSRTHTLSTTLALKMAIRASTECGGRAPFSIHTGSTGSLRRAQTPDTPHTNVAGERAGARGFWQSFSHTYIVDDVGLEDGDEGVHGVRGQGALGLDAAAEGLDDPAGLLGEAADASHERGRVLGAVPLMELRRLWSGRAV